MTEPLKRGPKKGSSRSYVMTEEIRQKMRESSARRWAKQSQRDHLSKVRTIHIPVVEIKTLYGQGWSMKRIGEKFGVNADTIMRRMRENGIASRKAGEPGHHWNDSHHNWKADKAGYAAVHTRLNRRFGKPKHCEVCGTTEPNQIYDWANQTGRYDDINDYKRMCRSCHAKYDASRRKKTNDKPDVPSSQPTTVDQPMSAFTWAHGRFYRNNSEPSV